MSGAKVQDCIRIFSGGPDLEPIALAIVASVAIICITIYKLKARATLSQQSGEGSR